MPFSIIRNDITRVKADAIVNTANPRPVIGAGTDTAIYQAAGAEKLLAERAKIGNIPVGKAAATSAFDLDAKFIIHTVGPAWRGGKHGEEEALRSCYEESLKLAVSLSCESIAFPLISAGSYGFPTDLAIKTATGAIYDFLMENDMMVYLVVFGRRAYDLSGKLFSDVNSYIDEHYVSAAREKEYGHPLPGASGWGNRPNIPGASAQSALGTSFMPDAVSYAGAPEPGHLPNAPKAKAGKLSGLFHRRRREQEDANELIKEELQESSVELDEFKSTGTSAVPAMSEAPETAPLFDASIIPAGTLEEHIKATGDTFQEYLLKLIIEKKQKNSDVYRHANLSKQHFSKIISNRDYHPTKNTACALALSLHLDLKETRELLEKAGFTLSRSSKFDLAVEYFILNKEYNIVKDNIMLDQCGLELLGQH